MAMHFLPRSKNASCTSTPRGKHLAKFHDNRLKTEEVVYDARFPPPPHFFAIICHYYGNTLYATVKKMCLAQTTPQGKHLWQISWELVKNWGSSSRRKIFPPIFAIICRYHGNILSATVKKWVLHIYTPRHTSVLNFMRIGQKTEESYDNRLIIKWLFGKLNG